MARRSGLGKGLSALIPSESTGEPDSLLREVPISHIRPNAYQPRRHFDEESMSSLAASIRRSGCCSRCSSASSRTKRTATS
jgi:ParB family chromosome partitioning protein